MCGASLCTSHGCLGGREKVSLSSADIMYNINYSVYGNQNMKSKLSGLRHVLQDSRARENWSATSRGRVNRKEAWLH